MSEFQYDVRRLRDQQVAVVTLSGNLDSLAAHRLNEAFGVVVDSEVLHVVVDLVRVGYMNSEAWRILLTRTRELEANKGSLRLAHMPPDLESVFKTLGLSEIIMAYDDLEDALQASVEAASAKPSQG